MESFLQSGRGDDAPQARKKRDACGDEPADFEISGEGDSPWGRISPLRAFRGELICGK